MRKALDSDGDPSRYVRTVPRRGYEFVAAVIESVPLRADTARARGRGRASGYLAAGLLLAGSAGGVAWYLAQRSPETPILLQSVPLATDAEFESWPTFSPDGRQVAFQRTVEGHDAIFVKQIGEDAALRRTFDPSLDHAVSWSPDGRWIAFLRGGAAPVPLRLMVVPPVAGAEREIAPVNAPVGWSFRPAWTPDSRALIVPDRESSRGAYALHRISIDGGGRTRLTDPGESAIGEGDKDPAVSPDGTRLAFTRNGDLHLVELDAQYRPSGAPREVAGLADRGGLWGLAWTADSREIVFAAGEWPLARLFRVSSEGGPVRELTSLGAGVFAPAISRTGNRLAYMEWITSADIWQMRLDGDQTAVADPTRLISSSRLDGYPVHSPDGGRIAFHSNRAGRHQIWIAAASGQSARPLEPLRQGGGPASPESGLSWSPDQASLVFAARGALHVVDVASGHCRALTTGVTVVGRPVWSPDGRWVSFSSTRGGSWRISRVPADGGQPELLTTDGGSLLAASPDGLQLYYSLDDELWTIPAGGGAPIEILDRAPDDLVVTDRGLFTALNSFTSRIEYFDFASRTWTVVAELDRWIMGLSVSPDESALVYGLIDHKRADLMLVEGFE